MFEPNGLLWLAVLCCIVFSAPASAEGVVPGAASPSKQEENQTPFEYDYFEEMMTPVEAKEHERLCGLDKVCIDLWKKGKMKVYKEGRLFTGDYNSDGIEDEAIILEDDDPDDELSRLYYIYISCKDKNGQRKLEFHELLPEARNVVEVFWDKEKKALVIDTGGRVVKTESASTSVGSSGAGYVYHSGKVLKVVIIVTWNPKTGKFELIAPAAGKGKGKHLYK